MKQFVYFSFWFHANVSACSCYVEQVAYYFQKNY